LISATVTPETPAELSAALSALVDEKMPWVRLPAVAAAAAIGTVMVVVTMTEPATTVTRTADLCTPDAAATADAMPSFLASS